MHQKTAVLVPLKSFETAKGRLATVLGPDRRTQLVTEMAETVLAACGALPKYIVCDVGEVADWSAAKECSVIRQRGTGLNDAVRTGWETLKADGYQRVIVAHADLPNAVDLTWLAEVEGVVIVTDQERLGSNVMSLPTSSDFEFHYGPGSAALHQKEAHKRNLTSQVRIVDDLSFDVDTGAHLQQMGLTHK